MPIELSHYELKKLINLLQVEQTTLASLDMPEPPELGEILTKLETERQAVHKPISIWEAAKANWKV